jgi:hypothetical protein
MIAASRFRNRFRTAVRMLSTGRPNITARMPRAAMFLAPGAPASFASCANGAGTQRNAASSGGGGSSGSCSTRQPSESVISLRNRAKSANRNTMRASMESPWAASFAGGDAHGGRRFAPSDLGSVGFGFDDVQALCGAGHGREITRDDRPVSARTDDGECDVFVHAVQRADCANARR